MEPQYQHPNRNLDGAQLDKVRYHVEKSPSRSAMLGIKAIANSVDRLGFDPRTYRKAILLTHIGIDVYNISGKAISIAAGSTYFAALMSGEQINQTEIGRIFDCTGSTVSRVYRQLLPKIDHHFPNIVATSYYKVFAECNEVAFISEDLGLDRIDGPCIFESDRLKQKYS